MPMKHRVIPFAIFMFGFATLVSLGVWQLHRAEEKRVRHETFIERMNLEPIPLDLIERDVVANDYLWRQTEVQGHYLDTQILLDNRIRKGNAGYEVMTPFKSDGGRTVLINRGWIPLAGNREVVPKLPVPTGRLTLKGFVGPEPVVGIELPGGSDSAERLSANTLRFQRPSISYIERAVDLKLWPALIYLDEESSSALMTDWAPPGDGSDRHTAYAVQWFAMSAVVVIFGLWFLSVRRER